MNQTDYKNLVKQLNQWNVLDTSYLWLKTLQLYD